MEDFNLKRYTDALQVAYQSRLWYGTSGIMVGIYQLSLPGIDIEKQAEKINELWGTSVRNKDCYITKYFNEYLKTLVDEETYNRIIFKNVI